MARKSVPSKLQRATGSIFLRKAAKETTAVRRVALELANKSFGREAKKLDLILKFVLQKLPYTEALGKNGKIIWPRYFKTSQKTLVAKQLRNNNCVDRCNLLISLLTSSGVKAWTVRRMDRDWTNKSWRMHDFVEAVIDGKVHSINISHDRLSGELVSSVHQAYGHELYSAQATGEASYFLRGADSRHIGGVKGFIGMRNFSRRFADGKLFAVEKRKNERRIDLMVEQGIMPKAIGEQLKKSGFQ
ncbi:MAG: hypothetical protein WCW44_03970 [archaeon]